MAAPTRLYDGFLPGRHAIDGYGNGGFSFGGMSHRGSLLALPDGIHAWAVQTLTAATPETLKALIDQAGILDVLLIGAGALPYPLPRLTAEALKQADLRYELMPTAAAARTYSVLLAENRRVAAALIAVA
jgi:uncharacterized protein